MPRIYNKKRDCIYSGCGENHHYALGYCLNHYNKYRRTGSAGGSPLATKCKVCGKPRSTSKFGQKRILCEAHYAEYQERYIIPWAEMSELKKKNSRKAHLRYYYKNPDKYMAIQEYRKKLNVTASQKNKGGR